MKRMKIELPSHESELEVSFTNCPFKLIVFINGFGDLQTRRED